MYRQLDEATPGQNLLPTAQAWRVWRPGPAVPAPGTGNRHINLFGHLIPGQALVPKLQDLLCASRMRRSATTHRDAGLVKPFTDGGPMNAQLGTDLTQGPALGVQVGCMLNVHRGSVTAHAKGGSPLDRGVYVDVSD